VANEIVLWPEVVVEDRRQEGGPPRVVRNVTRPVLVPHVPVHPAPGSPAAVIAPGGGFVMLSIDTEGHQLAELLAAQGVTAYVLEYRLMATPVAEDEFADVLGQLVGAPDLLRQRLDEHLAVAVDDGEQAIRLLRERHGKVALVGFSAGGILTAAVAVSKDPDVRPDLAACLYTPFLVPTHASPEAPPLFLAASADDWFGTEGSFDLHRVWTTAGRPVELHVFPRGGHGYGMTRTGHTADAWPDLLVAWLRDEGLLSPP
jgi:acetyl esterase/lipase